MFRTNLAYLAVLVGLYLVLYPLMVSIPRFAVRGAVYATGGMIVIFITAIPYFIQDHLQLWFDSLFLIKPRWSRPLTHLIQPVWNLS
jgi:hypothetical protein